MSKKLQLVIILAENRKKTKGMPSSRSSYKTKEEAVSKWRKESLWSPLLRGGGVRGGSE